MDFSLEPTLVETGAKIRAKITDAQKILVIASQPVDSDSAGSSIALAKWLQLQSKDVDLFSAADFSKVFTEDFPPVSLIIEKDFTEVDFGIYDLYFIIDSGTFRMAFGDSWEALIVKLDKSKLILIDHHQLGDIAEATEFALIRKGYSTVETLWPYLLKDSEIKINKEIASLLYYAHIHDTIRFTLVDEFTYPVAEDLLSFGVDHHRLIDFNISEEVFRFTARCIDMTHTYSAIHTLVLGIDAESTDKLNKEFGDNWPERDLDGFYKETFLKHIKGYFYGFVLEQKEGKVKLRWRIKDNAQTVEVASLLTSAGFENVGGHRNAGGGTFTGEVKAAEEAIVAIMKKVYNGYL